MRCSLLVLSTYLDGELETHKRGELEGHLVGCQRCRSGLGYLSEEVERIAALAPVHVPDHSVHLMLEQLGLLGASDPLPYRAAPTAVGPADAPPWLASGGPGKALPWDSRAVHSRRPERTQSVTVVLPGQAQDATDSDPDDQPLLPMSDTIRAGSPDSQGHRRSRPPGA